MSEHIPVWWSTPVIPALERQRQVGSEVQCHPGLHRVQGQTGPHETLTNGGGWVRRRERGETSNLVAQLQFLTVGLLVLATRVTPSIITWLLHGDLGCCSSRTH